ncbi:MAG: RIP metalloprotease RseP [Gammaproteobacteria bacterium]|nr:RIP metalloprotease RseP [Gammaproteobacteria bacterium]MDH3429665.1 RIP metalloprotease RseP [Gammaproteobacteria bacterium]MDH3433457.1 RIP metalloprotease RseP [Gammaproteobacteria bacterium]
MGDALTSLLAFIVAISVLVAIHEYGHYIIGRWAGMKVLRFSIGFGKPLWTWVRGDDRTEYCISAIPLGGYVRFLDSREGPVAPADEGRAFNHRPIPARIAVLLAGPMFNFLFAILAYWVLFLNGIPTLQPAVGNVSPDSYAAKAGLEFGDKIVAVGDVETGDWESTLVNIFDQMVANGRVPLTLETDNGRQRRTTISVGEDASRLTEPNMLFEGLGFEPWQPPAVIGELIEDGAAAGAGLSVGDRITSVDGERIKNYGDLVGAVSGRAGQQVAIEFIRDGRARVVDIVIGKQEVDGETRGLLGVRGSSDISEYYYLRKFGPIASVGEAAHRTWTSTLFTLRMLGRMVTGDVSIKNISGPINIAQFAGDSAQRGLSEFLAFLALVSISLGVLNLLPVPVLDGGQIVYQSIELAKGSPLSERAQIIGQQFGVLALILLMSFAFYNDIARILG